MQAVFLQKFNDIYKKLNSNFVSQCCHNKLKEDNKKISAPQLFPACVMVPFIASGITVQYISSALKDQNEMWHKFGKIIYSPSFELSSYDTGKCIYHLIVIHLHNEILIFHLLTHCVIFINIS